MTAVMSPAAIESTDARVAHRAGGQLRAFNDAGVLSSADIHTALAICRIGRESDDRVALALALTVRALRMGSVCIDLDTVHAQVHDESEAQLDVTKLPWPQPEEWRQAVTVSALVATKPDEPPSRPLRLAHGLLYLERYWQQEELVRRELQERFGSPPPQIDRDRLASALHRLFPPPGLVHDETDRQALAAAVAALARITVLAGGPGTGKTTTVARLVALLNDQPGAPPRIALAAPTGKAAARLAEAVHTAAGQLSPEDRSRLGDISASTLHRLLGWVPESRGRFRHHGRNRLPHDLVVVDEMSMVSLTMMARLLDALRPEARLVMVGDPDQLSSVEAGAVLADIARAPGQPSADLGRQLSELRLIPPHNEGPIHGVVQLTHTWRFGGAIDQLAKAIRASDPDAVVDVLRSGTSDVVFAEVDVESARPPGLEPLAEQVRRSGAATRKAAAVGDVTSALAALDHHRLLCAHRRGPFGVARWSSEVERWLSETEPGYAEDGEWYLGRPLLVTANDYELGLFNGDTGVVVDTPDGLRVAFATGAQPTLFAPVRLDAVQTVHAMTVHRAQGSQFDCVSLIVPPPDSPLLTRELLYTAVTRATERVQVFGSEEAIRRAVLRPANRASGLRSRLG
jgi:exodeoxyribonuclease V alpha subunit